MATPPHRTPREPPRPARRSDAYLFAPTIVVIAAAVLTVAHTLLARW